MLMLGGRSSTIEYGMNESKSALESGRAYKKFLELVSRQGGDLKCIENPDQYPYPKHSVDILSNGDGYVESINALEIGLACIDLGAGRKKIRDKIDPNAGLVFRKKIGDPIKRGERVATIYADRREGVSSAKSRIEGAIRYSASRPQARPLILSKIEIDTANPENVIVHPWGGEERKTATTA